MPWNIPSISSALERRLQERRTEAQAGLDAVLTERATERQRAADANWARTIQAGTDVYPDREEAGIREAITADRRYTQADTYRTVTEDLIVAISGGGGLGGAVRDNTDELRRLREILEAEIEASKRLEVAPGAAPVLPEFLQASELRYVSRQVQNKLVGGVVS